MKDSDISDATCNLETDRLELRQLQFHRPDRRDLSQTMAQQPRQTKINSVPRTPNACSAKRFSMAGTRRESPERTASTENVSLAGHSLTELPPGFGVGTCSQIKSLDIRNNLFASFPMELLRLVGLKILRLDNNSIPALPPEISRLSQLQILTVSHNALSAIELGVGRLCMLTALVLNDNQISDWPSWLCASLPRLKLLHLHGNVGIGGIPLTFMQANQLTDLSFDWFSYIVPPIGKNLKGTQGQHYIAETRGLCKRIEQRMIRGQRPGMKSERKCGFLDFLVHFMRLEQTNLAPTLYPKSRSPLHLAAMYGHLAIVRDYTAKSDAVDLNAQDAEGSTAFSLALRCNRMKAANLLLVCDRVDITKPGMKHGSPLQVAIIREQYEVARQIVARPELDPNALDVNGQTALHYLFAKYASNITAISHLCARLTLRIECRLNIPNKNAYTPLHCAARNQQDAAVRFALNFNRQQEGKRKFDFGARGGKDGATALHYVARYCDMETLTLCLRLEKQIDVFATDGSGRTARDHVKNSMSGKLLLRREKTELRRLFVPREANPESDSGDIVTDRKPGYAEIIKSKGDDGLTHVLINRATMSPRSRDLRGPDSWDVNEIDGPIDVMSYTTAPPTMFADLHRMNETLRASQTRYDEVRVEVADCAPELQQARGGGNMGKTLSVVVANYRPGSFKDEPQTTKAQPMRPAEKWSPPRVEGEDRLSQTYKAGLELDTVSEEGVLFRNQFAFAYRILTQSEVLRSSQYRLLYHVFSSHTSDAAEILLLLAEKLRDRSPIKPDAIYLLGVLKERKALHTLDKLQGRIGPQHGVLAAEIAAARRGIKAGRNCMPVRYSGRTTMQPTSAGDSSLMQMLQTQKVAAEKVGRNAGRMGELQVRSKRPQQPTGNRVHCVHVNRTLNYFV